jgi:hypothetical protein
MTTELTARDAEIRRLRTGQVKRTSTTAGLDLNDLEFERVASAASLAWREQLERIDRFSLPLQAAGRSSGERARASTTARLFLEQLASDYRRVASPELDLESLEARRKSAEGSAALKASGVDYRRSIAPLAVGRHLASDRGDESHPLEAAMTPWLVADGDVDLESSYVAAFGIVLGPVVRLALHETADFSYSMPLPEWSERVGEVWCEEFLSEGAAILRDPSELSNPRLGGSVLITSRRGTVDVTQTIDEVIGLAAEFRPVVDVRVGVADDKPKIDIVLGGEALMPDEFGRFMQSIADVPADVMLLPNAIPADARHIVRARARLRRLMERHPKGDDKVVIQLLAALAEPSVSVERLAEIEKHIADLEVRSARRRAASRRTPAKKAAPRAADTARRRRRS